MPVYLPLTCRVGERLADTFGNGQVDRVTYSMPTRHDYRPVCVKLHHARVAIAIRAEVRSCTPSAAAPALIVLQIGFHHSLLLQLDQRVLRLAEQARGRRQRPITRFVHHPDEHRL